MDREERIESCYGQSTRQLAEWLITAEDAYEQRGEDMSALEAKLRKLRIERDALQEDSRMLRALEAAGVDNWKGYSEVTAELYEEDE